MRAREKHTKKTPSPDATQRRVYSAFPFQPSATLRTMLIRTERAAADDAMACYAQRMRNGVDTEPRLRYRHRSLPRYVMFSRAFPTFACYAMPATPTMMSARHTRPRRVRDERAAAKVACRYEAEKDDGKRARGGGANQICALARISTTRQPAPKCLTFERQRFYLLSRRRPPRRPPRRFSTYRLVRGEENARSPSHRGVVTEQCSRHYPPSPPV